jgi:hypothetical protein
MDNIVHIHCVAKLIQSLPRGKRFQQSTPFARWQFSVQESPYRMYEAKCRRPSRRLRRLLCSVISPELKDRPIVSLFCLPRLRHVHNIANLPKPRRDANGHLVFSGVRLCLAGVPVAKSTMCLAHRFRSHARFGCFAAIFAVRGGNHPVSSPDRIMAFETGPLPGQGAY